MAALAEAAPTLRRLRKRSEFTGAARGARTGRPNLSLQMVASAGDIPGIGFTVTKKVGNAPVRNRIKRRLRAAVDTCADRFRPRHDYVLIGRREALSAPFATLVGDLTSLLRRVHEPKPPRMAGPQPQGTGAE